MAEIENEVDPVESESEIEQEVEQEESPDASSAETEQEESSEDQESDAEDEASDNKVDEESEESPPQRLPKWAKERVKEAKERANRAKERTNELERKLYAQQERLLELERNQSGKQNAQQEVNYDPNTQIVDPFTGQVVSLNSVEGQVVVKLQQAAEIQQKEEQKAQKAKEKETIKEKLAVGVAKFDDYMDVVSDLPFTQTMLEAAALSDKADEFIYQLGKYNRDDVIRITKLSPKEQFKEIVLLENKFSHQKTNAKPITPPPSQIKGSGHIEKEPERMDFHDLLALRRKKERGL